MRHGKTQGKEFDAHTNLKGILTTLSPIIILFLALSGAAIAQIGSGSLSRESRDTTNNADQNLKSIARVNPSTLAMEFSLPFMSYPGRNGNSVPVAINYSSKMWRMETGLQWFYRVSTQTRYVTDIRTVFAEHSMAGWTSSLTPPKLVEKDTIYDESGDPYSQNILNENGLNNHWLNVLSGFAGNNSIEPCGTRCNNYNCELWGTTSGNIWICTCTSHETDYCQTGGGSTIPDPPTPTQLFTVKRMEVTMPDGSTHEFRKDDSITSCGNSSTGCSSGSMEGTYLSVDGSGMKIKHSESGTRTLYLPNGSRYEFSSDAATEHTGLYASEYIDADGNKQSFLNETTENVTNRKWTDTMGREIVDPFSHKGTQEINLPGLNGSPLKYEVKWEKLKPSGCEANDPSTCTAQQQQLGGALEDQTQKLYYETRYFCRGNSSTDLLTDASTPDNPVNEVLFPHKENGIRPCDSFDVLRDSQGQPILDANNTAQPYATRFNPQVLSEIKLPNGKKYIFKYNRYGEISKIIYPTGSYETFTYGRMKPMNGSGNNAYDQTNRGVTERSVYDASGAIQQRWQYSAEVVDSRYKITTRAPKGNDPYANYIQSERFLYIDNADGGNFGFSDPRAGMPKEERIYAENDSVNPRSRTLTSWITKDVTSNYQTIKRDARVEQTISIAMENGQALATSSKNEYETPGSNNSSAPTDPEYFAHLNVKRAKGYQYAVIPLSMAQNGTISQIASYFNSSLLASVSETDYRYDDDINNPVNKVRGIPSLPIETRVLNPQNLNQVIARTQTVYDEYGFVTSGDLSGSLIDTWTDPANDHAIPPASRAVRGKPTTVKIWDSDNSTPNNDVWIQTHSQYDKYGNVRKVWEPNENISSDRFVETEFSVDYGFAYPTKVKTPAPGDGISGTNQGSTASTTYDFMTGLPLTATNDFDQTTKTEYDALLRPTKTYGDGTFTIPETQTVYNDDQLWIKVRKQIDANNWDEATTFSDSLGRTVKTQSKDSQGDVFVETQYDFLGRVTATSNPYRQGDTKYWSKPRYDELSRAVESFAPAQSGQTGASLGVTEYGISTMAGYVGTIVTTTDAAGKKGRSFTNALGQLIRVDEPDYAGGLTAVPQGSPNPSPTPNVSPTPYDPPPSCSVPGLGCLTETDYPSYATLYKYDERGNLKEVNQGAQTRTFTYDSFSRIRSATNPESGTVSYTYDVLGNLKTKRDARGIKTIYDYDKANRITNRCYRVIGTGALGATTCASAGSETIEPNTPDVSYFYDGKGLPNQQAPNYAKGKLTKISSAASETLYTNFDDHGRILTHQQIIDGRIYSTSYKYNFAGALAEETYPSGKIVRNFYDTDGDLSQVVKNGKTYASDFSYTVAGAIQRMRLGNGNWESAVYNERLQLTQIGLGNAPNNTTNLWKVNYEYGELNTDGTTVNAAKNNGNIAKQIITVPTVGASQGFTVTQTYTYDSINRLKQAKETIPNQTGWQQTFDYDRFGNRSFDTNEANTTIPANCPTAVCNPQADPANNKLVGYQYDNAGNTKVDAENRTFIYDGENKQVEVKDQYGISIGKYFYDGDGKRIKKQTNTGEITIFVYDAQNKLVAEYSNQISQTPQVNYLTVDYLGSPRINTDKNGSVIARHDYLPFGEEIARANYSADNVSEKFATYERDKESSLDFAQARMYHNNYGRFTSPDVFSGFIDDPQTFNKYVYVMNNPINLIDPSGYCGVTAGSTDGSPCIWLFKGTSYQSVSEKEYGDGSASEYEGWARVENPSSVSTQLTSLDGTYALDGEYQSFVRDGTTVGLGENGRFVGIAQVEVTLEDVDERILIGDTKPLSVSDQRRIAENPIDFVKNGRISNPKNSMPRRPDYITGCYSAFSTGACVTNDMYGNIYLSPVNVLPRSPINIKASGLSFVETFKVGGNVSLGWLNQTKTPTSQQLQNFNTGPALNVSLGSPRVLGGGVTYSPGNGTATEIGAYIPGPGLTGTMSHLMSSRGLKWR